MPRDLELSILTNKMTVHKNRYLKKLQEEEQDIEMKEVNLDFLYNFFIGNKQYSFIKQNLLVRFICGIIYKHHLVTQKRPYFKIIIFFFLAAQTVSYISSPF